MKIIRTNVPNGSIESFAYVYCLTMCIRKVEDTGRLIKNYKYYASFDGVSIQTNSGTAFVQGVGGY